MAASKHRAWILVLNNPTEQELQFYSDERNFSDCSCYVCAHEFAPETGTPHLHAHIRPNSPRSLDQMRKRYCPDGSAPRAHWESARGSDTASRDYVVKDGDVLCQFGEFREQRPGTRSDLVRLRDRVLSGECVSTIVREAENYQQLRFVEAIARYAPQTSPGLKNVYWFYGPSGSGKTLTAFSNSPDAERWISSGPLKFWNGYSGQRFVILDDLRPTDVPYHQLLRLLDRYPFNVEVKGGYVPLVATHIFITSPFRPETFVPCGEEVNQLIRRISEIREFFSTKEDAFPPLCEEACSQTPLLPPTPPPSEALCETSSLHGSDFHQQDS